jgi:hypothetical protein
VLHRGVLREITQKVVASLRWLPSNVDGADSNLSYLIPS